MTRTLDLKKELKKCKFRIAVFGSARIKMNDRVYKQVFELAKMIGMRGYDLLTGGGPGLMEAASAGHDKGDKKRRAEMIGLTIKLPFEQSTNKFLEYKKDFARFSGRLETFMKLSDVIVVTKGGIGTLLELSYAWQLIQVGHVPFKPIILVGPMWPPLIKWIKKYMLKENLVSAKDFNCIMLVKNNRDAMRAIDTYHKKYVKEDLCHHVIMPKLLDR